MKFKGGLHRHRTFWVSTVFMMTLMQAAWTIAAPQTGPKPQPSVLNVPGYGPGVAYCNVANMNFTPLEPACQSGTNLVIRN